MPGESQEFAMRSRVARTASTSKREEAPAYSEIAIIERKLKAGDTLNKLAIQYNVNVGDIKKANNLTTDMEFGILKSVKIPVSRLRLVLDNGLPQTSSDDSDEYVIDCDDREALLGEKGNRSRDTSVEDIFHKADSTIAQARTALPEDASGQFHFVDARPPSSGFSVWALLIAVVVIFMIVPLILTVLEEQANEEPNDTGRH